MSTSLDLTYWEYSSGGHQIWPRVYNTAAMYNWMFAHSLAVPEPSALALAGSALIGLILARRRHRRARVDHPILCYAV
jgi:hypothetical protein